MRRVRRALVLVAAVSIVIVSIVSGPALGTSAATTIRVSVWDNYLPPSVIAAFEKATGIKVKVSPHTTDSIVRKLEASRGSGFDVVFLSGPHVESLIARGWAAELDHDLIPNTQNLYPAASRLAYDPGNRFSLPYTWGTTGLCWRSDLTSTPKSWWDLLTPKPALRGKVTMPKSERWLMLPALLALGYSINTVNPPALEKAAAVLTDARKSLLAYDDTTFHKRLLSGQAHLVQAWDGWCNYAVEKNPKVRFAVPKEGSDLWVDAMVVLRKSKAKLAATQFVDFVLRPDSGRAVSELVLYKTPNAKAMAQVRKSLAKRFPNLAMPPSKLITFETERDLGEGQELWSRTVAEIVR